MQYQFKCCACAHAVPARVTTYVILHYITVCTSEYNNQTCIMCMPPCENLFIQAVPRVHFIVTLRLESVCFVADTSCTARA